MGFKSFTKFNVVLLTKQGWWLLNNPDYLLAQDLKAKYYPSSDFLSSSFRMGVSYTWHNIWAVKMVVQDGLCWTVGMGECISIFDHA